LKNGVTVDYQGLLRRLGNSFSEANIETDTAKSGPEAMTLVINDG